MSEFNIYVNNTPQDFLKNGDDFLEAAWRCIGRDENGIVQIAEHGMIKILPAATIVNAAFALEMYLKAILQKDKIKYSSKGRDGHDLYNLFTLLENNQEEIDIINKFVGYSKDGTSLFEEFAYLHAKDFVHIRYYVETSGWTKLDPLVMITYAYNLGNAAKFIISK